MTMVYRTEMLAINEKGEKDTWEGPNVWAASIEDAYLLLFFLGMHHVSVVEKIETTWN